MTVWNTVVQSLASRVKMWIQILTDSKNCVTRPATSPLRESGSFMGKTSAARTSTASEFAVYQSVPRALPALFCFLLVMIEKHFHHSQETHRVRPVFLMQATLIPNPKPLFRTPPPEAPLSLPKQISVRFSAQCDILAVGPGSLQTKNLRHREVRLPTSKRYNQE